MNPETKQTGELFCFASDGGKKDLIKTYSLTPISMEIHVFVVTLVRMKGVLKATLGSVAFKQDFLLLLSSVCEVRGYVLVPSTGSHGSRCGCFAQL